MINWNATIFNKKVIDHQKRFLELNETTCYSNLWPMSLQSMVYLRGINFGEKWFLHENFQKKKNVRVSFREKAFFSYFARIKLSKFHQKDILPFVWPATGFPQFKDFEFLQFLISQSDIFLVTFAGTNFAPIDQNLSKLIWSYQNATLLN